MVLTGDTAHDPRRWADRASLAICRHSPVDIVRYLAERRTSSSRVAIIVVMSVMIQYIHTAELFQARTSRNFRERRAQKYSKATLQVNFGRLQLYTMRGTAKASVFVLRKSRRDDIRLLPVQLTTTSAFFLLPAQVTMFVIVATVTS